MNIEENNNKFKVIAGVLALFLVVLAVYTGKLYNDNKDTITILKSEKFDIESDLEHLIADYNQVIQDNEIKDKELIEAKKRIEALLIRVKDSEANIALIKRYRNEIGRLKDERSLLFKRANKIRICFALAPNEIAEKEDKLLYIQVINPKNNLLGEREVLNFENGTLNYSISTKVFYEKEELDVCVLVNSKEEDLLKGLYNINVFDGSTLISTSKMILK